MNSVRYFYPCTRQKNVEFSARSGDLVDVEGVLLGSSEYVGSCGVGNFLVTAIKLI